MMLTTIRDVDDYNISGTITTTETSFVSIGTSALSVLYSENGTRISLTVSEIFDRKHIALNAIFLYSSSLLLFDRTTVQSNIPTCSVEQVSIRNSWCWRLYISETVTTTETTFHQLVARLLTLAKVKTELEYLLPFWRYSTGNTSPERDISLFLLSRMNSFDGFYCLQRRTGQHSKFPILPTIYLWNDKNDGDVVCTIW